MKKISLVLSVISLILLLSCEGADYASRGKDAAVEFCKCIDSGKSMEDCEEELRDEYTNLEITNEEFMNAFNNEAASCGVELVLKN